MDLLLIFSTYALQPSRLIVRSALDLPTFAPAVSTRVTTREHPAAEGGTLGEKCPEILPKSDFHVTFRNFLHTVKLQHEIGGFISSPKEGVLRIFSP
jgi:hypothetical protein